MLNRRSPMPKRARTDRGWPWPSRRAESHAGSRCARQASRTIWSTLRKMAGAERRSQRWATLGLSRSAATRYWIRSFEPIEMKSVLAQDRVDAHGRRRDLDHHARLHVLAERDALAAEAAAGLLDQAVDVAELLQGGDHGEEHVDFAVTARAEDRPDLAIEEARVLEREPDRAPAHEGVGLVASAEVRDGLVAAEVERADRRGSAGRGLDHLAVVLVLLLLVGHVLMGEEQVLGAEQAHARAAPRPSRRPGRRRCC